MRSGWFRRARQTRTQVDDPSAEHISRQKGALAAYRTLAAYRALAVQLEERGRRKP